MSPERFIKIPSMVIHPDSLVLYSKLEYFDFKSSNRSYSHLLKYHRRNSKVLSTQARRKIDKAIKYLIYLAHEKEVYSFKKKSKFVYKVGFITLTLASQQRHTDKEITEQLLHQFLVEAKQKWKVCRYVWKAEYQRNGNIHYHLLVDRYIPFSELRNVWNRIQNKLGYIDRAIYKNSAYSYNSTDIHSLYNVKDVCSYITKYMMKSVAPIRVRISRKDFYSPRYCYTDIASLTGQCVQGCQIDEDDSPYYYSLSLREQRKLLSSVSSGAQSFLSENRNRSRIWGCSVDLSNVRGCQGVLEDFFRPEIDRLRNDKSVVVYDKEYYSVFYFKKGYISSVQYPLLFNHFQQYLSESFICASKQLVFDPFT